MSAANCRSQSLRHTVLDDRGGAFECAAIDLPVLTLGLLVKDAEQLGDRGLAKGTKLDGNAETGHQTTNAPVLRASTRHVFQVSGLDQRQKKLLLDIHPRKQAMLELAPAGLHTPVGTDRQFVRKMAKNVVQHPSLSGQLCENHIHGKQVSAICIPRFERANAPHQRWLLVTYLRLPAKASTDAQNFREDDRLSLERVRFKSSAG
jgi:hypothetical protein